MNNVKAPASSSYQDYLISRLRDRAYAATYLETHLETDPAATAEPELLHLALLNVLEAASRSQRSLPQSAHQQKLDALLRQPGSQAIPNLADWLAELGLKLTVIAQPPTSNPDAISLTHILNQLSTSNPHTAALANLLRQLQSAIETETDLPPADKTEALEQVATLAKAGATPQDSTLKKLASTSVKILKGTIATLPDTAKLADACSKLLPLISKAIGLG